MIWKIFLFISLFFLLGCSTPEAESCVVCPPCAIAGPKVAQELEKVCDDKKCPHTIDWLNRHAKVCDILNKI